MGFPLPFTLVFFTLLLSVLWTVFFPFICDFFRLAAASLAFNTASLNPKSGFLVAFVPFLLPADAFFSVTFLLVVLVLVLLLLPFLFPLPRFLPTAGRPFVLFLSFLPFPLPLPLPLPPRPLPPLQIILILNEKKYNYETVIECVNDVKIYLLG